MYIKDGLVFAGEAMAEIKVIGIHALPHHKLWCRFSNGEAGVFDFAPLLDEVAFQPLQDEAVFRDVYIDYGIPTWMDGEIDIDPEYLYKRSVLAETA